MSPMLILLNKDSCSVVIRQLRLSQTPNDLMNIKPSKVKKPHTKRLEKKLQGKQTGCVYRN